MKSVGKLYLDTLKYPPKFGLLPIVDKGWTNEIEPPFRRGSCLVFRVPFVKTGLVIGVWGEPTGRGETQALTEALSARPITLDVVRDIHDPVWEGYGVSEE